MTGNLELGTQNSMEVCCCFVHLCVRLSIGRRFQLIPVDWAPRLTEVVLLCLLVPSLLWSSLIAL